MGVAKAQTTSALGHPRYLSNWMFKSKLELFQLHQQVRHCLAQSQYGVYNAVVLLFGVDAADELAERMIVAGLKNRLK
jgi:hypothetical protein